MRKLVFMMICGVLTGCQTTPSVTSQHGFKQKTISKSYNKKSQSEKIASASVKDGAPKGPLPTSFKQVRPKNEPFSRYGNPDIYQVDGHTYKVMQSSSGYRTRGMASWYGTKFHSKRTSSGEDYNMYALTAAHKTLPLPSYVKVKNLSNGKQIIVKVNDRGPFHSDRVIDLSYGAAVKLGLLPKGTAPVEIEALTMTSSGKARTAHYYLQAGAFNSAALAQQLRIKLAHISPSPVVVEKYQHRYIVTAGPFANKQMTDHLKLALAKKGVHGAFSLLK